MTVENFKGIQFVRISSLAKEQQRQLWDSIDPEKIIKIVKDQSLMNDCILYSDFLTWKSHRVSKESMPVGEPAPIQPILGKLAFE